MEGNFSKILALVDYSAISLHAAEEAALIASKFGSKLHLLHVSRKVDRSNLLGSGAYFFDAQENDEQGYYEKVDRLQKLKIDLLRRYDVSSVCFEERGSFLEVVKKHVVDFQINLVVLGSKRRSWLGEIVFQGKATSIIKDLDCEVLCVNPESDSKQLKKIVLPIGKFVPKKRIRLAYELGKKFSARIHLIALNNQVNNLSNESAKTLIASYQYLKDVSNIPIECCTVQGKSLAEATMNYAKVVGADLILINEGAESDLSGRILSKWRGNIVYHSSVPVLSVNTMNEGSQNKQNRLSAIKSFS